MNGSMQSSTGSLRRFTRRVLQTTAFLTGGLLLVAVTLLVLLMVPGVRERAFVYALERARAAIPGSLSIEHVSWPSPGSLTLDAIAWTDGVDTLLAARRVGVTVNLRALVKRDVRVEDVQIDGLSLDIPAVRSSLPPQRKAEKTPIASSASQHAFPRGGALPGIPSFAVRRVVVTATSIRLDSTTTLSNVALDGGCVFLSGNSPDIRIRQFTVTGPDSTWGVEQLSLNIDPWQGRMTGDGQAWVPGWPVFLSITSSAPDSFLVVLAESTSTLAPRAPGVAIRGKITRSGLDMKAIGFDASIRTPSTAELARVPELAASLSMAPPLEGLALSARGTLDLIPRLSLDVAVDLDRNAWLDEGHAGVVYDDQALIVKDLSIKLTDVTVAGNVSVSADSLDGHVSLHVSGNRTLALLQPELSLPDDLAADALLDVAGDVNDRLRVSVDANGQASGFRLDRIQLDSDLSLRRGASSSATLIVQAMDHYLGFTGRVERNGDLSLRLAPIEIVTTPIQRADLERQALSGSVHLAMETRRLTIDNLQIKGAEGELHADAQFDSSFAGTFAVDVAWPGPPYLLTRALNVPDAMVDSLRERWNASEPVEIAVRGIMSSRPQSAMRTTGRFSLPGPGTFATVIPSLQPVDTLGPIVGEFDIVTRRVGERMETTVAANIDSTQWIDSSVVRIHTAAQAVTIDTVGVAALGAAVGAAGTIHSGVYDLMARVACDSAFAPRLIEGAPKIALQSVIRYAGTTDAPDIAASVDAAVDGGSYAAKRIVGRFSYDSEGISTTVTLPMGLVTPVALLDSVTLDCRSVEHELFPARLELLAAGNDLRFFQSVRIDTTGGLTVFGDAFSLDIAGRTLLATGPFRLHRNAGGIEIDSLNLAGSLGEIHADGSLGEATTNLDGQVTVEFAQKPQSLNLPDHLWPEQLDVHVSAHDHDVRADALLKGFTLAHRHRSTLRVRLDAAADSVRAHVSIADESRSLLDAEIALPATVSVYPPKVSAVDGPFALEATIDQFPLALYFLRGETEIPKEEIARLNGRIALHGDTRTPVGSATATMSFPDWPKLSAYQLNIEARLGTGETPPDAELLRLAATQMPIAAMSNLLAAVSLNQNDRRVLFGALAHPLELTLQPPTVVTPPDKDIHAIFQSQGIPLEDFDPILPSDVVLKGSCAVDLSAKGAAENPTLSGTVAPKGLEVLVAEQARVVAEGKIEVSGTRLSPQVKGDIRIPQGLIRVPEDLKQLHPVEGSARLLPDRKPHPGIHKPSASDSTSSEGRRNEAQNGGLDVTITIPSEFWIRGRGLDLELSGDLHIRKQRAKPTVTGELRVIHGKFVFLGRSFKLERGTVNFYGQDEINPALDVLLSTRVSNTDIQIIVAGTAHKPQIILTSNPEMREGDIISVLLFGATFDDLSDNQADLVQQRTTEMVAALGAAELQKNVSGIDVVSYKGSDNQNESSTLTFGKYLNPDVLLSYVYAIDDQAGSFLSLEYFLKGNFKVDTLYGRRNQTGLGLGWAKDY